MKLFVHIEESGWIDIYLAQPVGLFFPLSLSLSLSFFSGTFPYIQLLFYTIASILESLSYIESNCIEIVPFIQICLFVYWFVYIQEGSRPLKPLPGHFSSISGEKPFSISWKQAKAPTHTESRHLERWISLTLVTITRDQDNGPKLKVPTKWSLLGYVLDHDVQDP